MHSGVGYEQWLVGLLTTLDDQSPKRRGSFIGWRNHPYVELLANGDLWIVWLLRRLFVEGLVGVGLYVKDVDDISKRLVFLKHYDFEARHYDIQCISCITKSDKFFFMVSFRTRV